jgi:dipeptidyl-peptidase-4
MEKKIAYAKKKTIFMYMTWLQNQLFKLQWKKNAVINGITDWVYEEEFAL